MWCENIIVSKIIPTDMGYRVLKTISIGGTTITECQKNFFLPGEVSCFAFCEAPPYYLCLLPISHHDSYHPIENIHHEFYGVKCRKLLEFFGYPKYFGYQFGMCIYHRSHLHG